MSSGGPNIPGMDFISELLQRINSEQQENNNNNNNNNNSGLTATSSNNNNLSNNNNINSNSTNLSNLPQLSSATKSSSQQQQSNLQQNNSLSNCISQPHSSSSNNATIQHKDVAKIGFDDLSSSSSKMTVSQGHSNNVFSSLGHQLTNSTPSGNGSQNRISIGGISLPSMDNIPSTLDLSSLTQNPMSLEKQREQDKKLRRAQANSNERKRMQSINRGFDSLRSIIPDGHDEKISKANVLQQTANYIRQLEKDKLNLQQKLADKLG